MGFKKKKLSELLADLPKTFVTPEIRVECPEEKKFKVPEILKERLLSDKEINTHIKDIITIDGIRVVFEHGWGLVRASNTQPVLVLRFEADKEEFLNLYKSKIEGILKEI